MFLAITEEKLIGCWKIYFHCQMSVNLPCRLCDQWKNVTSYTRDSVMNFQHVASALQAIHPKIFHLLQIQDTTPKQYPKPCKGYGKRVTALLYPKSGKDRGGFCKSRFE